MDRKRGFGLFDDFEDFGHEGASWVRRFRFFAGTNPARAQSGRERGARAGWCGWVRGEIGHQRNQGGVPSIRAAWGERGEGGNVTGGSEDF